MSLLTARSWRRRGGGEVEGPFVGLAAPRCWFLVLVCGLDTCPLLLACAPLARFGLRRLVRL